MTITKRQAQILAAIVREYSQRPEPVGSLDLAERYDFGVSSATIRNDMKALEDAGLIAQPHTSAGRVPTNDGFRFFVRKLMRHLELTRQEQDRLQQELKKLQHQYLEMGRSLTRLLAEQSGGAAFALLPGSAEGGPETASSAGLSNVIDESTKPEEIKEVAKFLEELAENKDRFFRKDSREVETYIGNEAPVPISSNFSMVVTRVALPGGKSGVVGVVGHKRMKYAKNISLLEYISKLLSSGLGAYLIISNF